MSASTPVQHSTRNTLLSSLVLTLTLVSDALLYLLLPLYFESFGLTLLWVGLLLSLNRFIRLLINPWLVSYFQIMGARKALLQAIALATIASLCFVLMASPWILLASRVLWGCAFALMRLACLHYATEERSLSLKNLGWFTSFQEIGPLLVMLLSPWLLTFLTLSQVLMFGTLLCVLAILPALGLPNPQRQSQAKATASWPKPAPLHQLTFLLCLLFDGVWVIILAPQLVNMGYSTHIALSTVAFIFAAKRIFSMVIGLISVRFALFANTYGWLVFTVGCLLVSGLLMPTAWILFASVLAATGHALLMILMPKLLADISEQENERQLSLSAFTFWRDFSVAIGALFAAILIEQDLITEFYWGSTLITMLLSVWIFKNRKTRSA
ncbi:MULTISPECIES: MFS transporter [Nitrincola]|uniref:Major Facilitator Superfamily protein n=1 Tax=Nitrincola nitratireducens TaxID=1229521 RepID=W9UYA5_9GAMM|nr:MULTISPECIES: MFS transporter [Nitrincola]EXJ09706.1 Major Facilitator Superfamily protein [Nitrincola nitratireducens]